MGRIKNGVSCTLGGLRPVRQKASRLKPFAALVPVPGPLGMVRTSRSPEVPNSVGTNAGGLVDLCGTPAGG